MGFMNKMRENTAVVLWILVFAFGGLWVLHDSGAFESIGLRATMNVAEVNGEDISYEQYSRTLDSYVQQYQAETGESIPVQLLEQYRNMVFDALVDNALMEQEIRRLGIKVSDSEVVEMVMGEDPDPLIRQQFSDEEGQLNRALLRSVIDNPEARQDWIRIEEYLRFPEPQVDANGEESWTPLYHAKAAR
jgi:peptidyl-prolyl cis-trans isomerase D